MITLISLAYVIYLIKLSLFILVVHVYGSPFRRLIYSLFTIKFPDSYFLSPL